MWRHIWCGEGGILRNVIKNSISQTVLVMMMGSLYNLCTHITVDSCIWRFCLIVVGFPLFLFHHFLETMVLSKSLISRIFLKPNQFWFQKNDGENINWRQKEIVGKMHKMIIQLLIPFTWNVNAPWYLFYRNTYGYLNW